MDVCRHWRHPIERGWGGRSSGFLWLWWHLIHRPHLGAVLRRSRWARLTSRGSTGRSTGRTAGRAAGRTHCHAWSRSPLSAICFHDSQFSSPVFSRKVGDSAKYQEEVIMSSIDSINPAYASTRWTVRPATVIESLVMLADGSNN
jgi:hypothetical protein